MSDTKLWRPAIEFNLTEHCNLKCAHCDHASSILGTAFADLESFKADVSALSGVLLAGEIKILGGEPLLHPRLLDFLEFARQSEIARRVVLVTNGVLLHRAPDELWRLIDGMWISRYPGVKHRFEWEWVQQQADKYNVFVWRKETPDFDQRLLVAPMEDDNLIKMVYQNCDLAHFESCHTVHQGRYYPCSPSVWTGQRLALSGIEVNNRQADSVQIHDNPRLKDEIDSLIKREQPLEACRYCLGSWARSVPNEQLNRRTTVEFLNRPPEPVSTLLDPELILPSMSAPRSESGQDA